MARLQRFAVSAWNNRWFLLAGVIVLLFLVREWSPPSYRITSANVPVHGTVLAWGTPIIVTVSRCNDTSQTTLIRYVRRMESEDGTQVWPLQEGSLPVDPGCLTRMVEVGFVPHGAPAGRWRVRTDYQSTNWLFKTTHTWWVSNSFEVVTPNA